MSDHKRNLTNGYYALRWQILERDSFTCQYCGQKAPNVRLEVDHIIAIEDGGNDDPDNLNTSCYACNRGKSGLSIIIKRKGKSTATSYIPNVIAPNRWRQDEALKYVASHSALTATELAQGLNITRIYASVLLNRLKGRHLIETNDNRWRIISEG